MKGCISYELTLHQPREVQCYNFVASQNMYPKLLHVSEVSLVDTIYGVHVDIVKFLFLQIHLRCYDLSPLQQVFPALPMVDLFIIPEQ